MDYARLLCFGFEGHAAPDSLLFNLDRDRVGAVILFQRNVADARQIRALCDRLRDAGGEDLWILIDQEGGRVKRITDPDLGPPAAAELGSEPPEAVFDAYNKTAVELRRLGIDFNLAPVADVMTNPRNKVLEGRAFGSDPEVVTPRVVAAVRGIRAAGVKSCAKHFPGLGEVDTDPHEAATLDPRTVGHYRRVHFPPFAAAIEVGVDAVMTTHILAVQFDPERIATYSPTIVRDYLEDELHFRHLVLSDDLEMKGLPEPPAPSAWRAFEAGHNLLLLCHDRRVQDETLRLFATKLTGDHSAQRLVRRALDRQQPFRKPFSDAPA